MLQRLIHKPPVPIDPIPLDKFIFDKNNRIRKYVLPICNNLDIDPHEIYPKSFQEFIGKEPSSNVLILRYNEWEGQRRYRIDNIREHVKDYLRARQKSKGSVQGSSPQTTQETGSSPRREHYISVNFDSAPRMTTAGSPTHIQVTLESPRNIKHGGEFDRFVTGSSMNYSTGRPILAAISRASYSVTSKRTLNGKDGDDSRDDIIINDEREDDIKKNFKRHLKHRIVNKERQVNASVLVTRKEEEFRNKMKEEYLERERKWNEKKQKLMLTKRQPVVRLDDHDKERKWRLKIEEKEEAITVIRRQVEINERLAMSEKKRKEENEKKFERIKERNRITQQRCQSVVERIAQSGERSPPVPADLQEIEKKLIESHERKEKLLRERKTNMGRVSGDIAEKLKKIQEKKEQEEQELMREIARKLEKGKLKEASSGPRKLRNDTSQTKSGVQQRLEEIRREEKRKERKLAEEFMMKEKHALERLSEKKNNLEDYIAERRERRQQRFNHTKINTSFVEEEYNKWIESTNRSYKEKLEEIKIKKSWQEKQVKVLEKRERKPVREDMRISYSFDQKC